MYTVNKVVKVKPAYRRYLIWLLDLLLWVGWKTAPQEALPPCRYVQPKGPNRFRYPA